MVMAMRISSNSLDYKFESFSSFCNDIPDCLDGEPSEVKEKTCIRRLMPTCSCGLRARPSGSRELLDIQSCMNHQTRGNQRPPPKIPMPDKPCKGESIV